MGRCLQGSSRNDLLQLGASTGQIVRTKRELMMVDLTGKTALITGASRGIGADTARVMAGAGAHVVLMARSGEELEKLAAEIGPQASVCKSDVADFGDWTKAVDLALEKTGRVDILVNNAGLIDPIARLEDSDPAAWSTLIDVNLKGVYYGVKAVLQTMTSQGSGTILNISSGAAHGPLEGWSAYCSSKAGAAMLTRCIQAEHGGTGIRVMGLSPGTVATDMQVKIKASGINPVSELDPAVHIPADWPAKALLWMCGEDSDSYLGEEISLRDEEVRRRVGLGE
ncbi:NADP-dependent 3-hydroxy acid dehydrogenase YdfG [Litoreibacter albidus]|uniref:NADP-dependent 3-hydroxy acid dehydrogenase YdfG n=2 Tax=Litoreibacter albidus TaxID=670155 RepID=A0A1H3C2I9_9RHOB|nr:NADP-dependent 3-hydroxy acid dehydrogenase YdfG [Litoreibacter albidus]